MTSQKKRNGMMSLRQTSKNRKTRCGGSSGTRGGRDLAHVESDVKLLESPQAHTRVGVQLVGWELDEPELDGLQHVQLDHVGLGLGLELDGLELVEVDHRDLGVGHQG